LQSAVQFGGTRVNVVAFISCPKSTAVPAPIFTKSAKAQQHYLQISDTDVYPNRTADVESTGKKLI
jgi:hypothetical protein